MNTPKLLPPDFQGEPLPVCISNPRQPETLVLVTGPLRRTFKLVRPFRWINRDRDLCEGPLYRLEAQNVDKYELYTPDWAYRYLGHRLHSMHKERFHSRQF